MPDWLLSSRVVLSAAVCVCGLVVLLARRRFQQRGIGATPWVVIGFALAIWIPERWRDYVVAGSAAIAVGAGISSGVWGLIAGAVAYGLAAVVPGGGSVLVLGGVIIGAVVAVQRAVSHLRAMKRTRRLEPGETPSGAVQIGGTFEGVAEVPRPALPYGEPAADEEGRKVAAWQLKLGDRCFCSTSTLRLVGEHGTALIEPAGVVIDSSHEHTFHDRGYVKQLAAYVGVEPKKGEGIDLCWIETGETGYARGIPRWQADARGREGGYRQSPLAPVFFSRVEAHELVAEAGGADGVAAPVVERAPEGGKDATYVANRPLDVLQRERSYRLCAWLLWGAACAAIVIVQAVH